MKGSSSMEKRMTFDEAWPILQEEAINKVIDNLEGPQANLFSAEQYMRFYTIVYNVFWGDIGDCILLYDKYRKTFEDYISSKVLPSLKGKENEDLLQELLRRWNNHKIMTRRVGRFFECMDRRFCPNINIPISLVGTSHMAFYNLVYGEMNNQIIDAVKSLIDRELEGGLEIDEAMVKQVLDIYMEIGNSSIEVDYYVYVKDFEEAMVNATTSALLYSKNANLESITNEESYEDYMLKVGECSNLEKIIFSNYFKFRNRSKPNWLK